MSTMSHQQFLHTVLDRLERSMPPGVLPWTARVRFSMLQIHFGYPRVHYELWLQGRTQLAEVGLHFEDEAQVSGPWCAAFAERAHELRHALGPEFEPEDWTANWMRLHAAVPLEPLDERFAETLAQRFGALIVATHEGIRSGPPVAGSGRTPVAREGRRFARRSR